MHELSRREVIHSLGLTAAASMLSGCSSALAAPGQEMPDGVTKEIAASPGSAAGQDAGWTYFTLDPAAVAAQVYALHADGGCMYGLFAGMMRCLARIRPEPYLSFPCHMMRYGGGGIGHWGSACGAINGGAAVIGLFERDKQRRENLIAGLLSWYESAELPRYQPTKTDGATPYPKSVARSVECHVSVSRWCKISGFKADSPERRERCRRLTVDVAIKTTELLNANLNEPCKVSIMSPQAKSCLSCHGEKRHDALAKMQCNTCHLQFSKDHPTAADVVPTANGRP